MKMIFAVIQPTQLRAVKQALTAIGVNRITICDSQEYAPTGSVPQSGLELDYRARILRKITLEIAVNDDFLHRTIATVESVARTGPRGTEGDGKIFILDLNQAIAFEPETRGPGAI